MAPAVHPIYRLFFLSVEPVTALAGFAAAFGFPHLYLHLTSPSTYPFAHVPTLGGLVRQLVPAPGAAPALHPSLPSIPVEHSVVLTQLANLYLLFALNEALVLRATNDLRVWRTLLFGLLVADLGHLWSVRELGLDIYWNVGSWNSMAFGNVGIVYAGALLRILFLLGVGVDAGAKAKST